MTRKRFIYIFLVVLILLSMSVTPALSGAAPTPLQLWQDETPPTPPPPPPPVRPDSPTDGRGESPRALSALAVGGTSMTFDPATKKARLKVDDGWDLNQYLFAASSPLDFYIDLQGIKPDPSKSAKLTMRVWDVDQIGAPGFPECKVEVDKVYANGTYLNDLTGANNQWSIVTFNIPAGTLNEGSNHFWVNIDTLTGWCWAVEVDWAEIEIPFNIGQIEASALDDVAIKRGNDVIKDPIWKATFDASGNIASPSVDDPIADKIKGWWFTSWGAREFKYNYKIGTWPSSTQPTWTPRVEYAWEIPGTGQSSNGFHEQTGWENSFKVTLPDKVGKYTLAVTLKIYHETDLLRPDSHNHALYVLLNSPVSGQISGAETGQPRTAWLDIATEWANGKGTEADVLVALNEHEYTNPRHWNYIDVSNNPATLIENDGANGNCVVFSDVWRVLAASLGIGTSSGRYYSSLGDRFMTSTRPALDGNASANARYKTSGVHDRWIFGMHAFGTYGGSFYDPTFGLKGPNTTSGKEGNVFCKVDAYNRDTKRGTCAVLSPPPNKVSFGYINDTINGWQIAEYEDMATNSPALSPASSSLAVAMTTAEQATFTGVHSDVGYDMDGNGLFEHLKVDVELNVTQAGRFAFMPVLLDASGNLIAWGDLYSGFDHQAPLLSTTLGEGVQTVSIYFNGRAIRDSGLDGSYSVKIDLVDENGNSLASADFTTSAYNHLQFQGLLPQIQTVSDSGVDTDSLPGYNLLRVTAQVDMPGAGNVTLQGQLFAGSVHLSDATATASWGTGTHAVDLDFPGAAIATSDLDGPYTVYLTISDGNYTANQEHTTAAYNSTAFQPAKRP